MSIKLIVAVSQNNVIGTAANAIPWKSSEDMLRFATLTRGNSVVMGRRTWMSLPERYRPLRDRRNYVLSRTVGEGMEREGARWLPSLEAAVRAHQWESGTVGNRGDLWVIGGGEIYRQAFHLQLPDELHVSRMHCHVFGDQVTAENHGVLDPSSVLLQDLPVEYTLVSTEVCADHDYCVYKRSWE